ncbi:MAG: DNA polymerase III subunit gamma/tau [Planctomycetota bacterium]
MDYQVIALKYRPQNFTQVVGQEVVSRTLTNAIRSHRVHNAYLFTGPRGTGKTSMARILAKALTCETGPTTEPCGVCEHCKRVTDSCHPDVMEIDAARHNGVDNVRDLSDGMTFAPTMARVKILIMDEVHMFSSSAWNALLKILEEPPAHVRFIFATTEVDSVPPTVISRCQRFDFRSLDLPTIVASLVTIAAKEGAKLSEPVLYRVARAAGGGMRDAQTLLDQLIAVSDGAASEEDLDLLLGAARGEDLRDMLASMLDGNSAPALERLDAVLAGGASAATVIDQLLEHLRGIMLLQACGPQAPAVKRLGLPIDKLESFAAKATPEKILRACQVLAGTQQQLRHGSDPRLCLDMATVRISRLGEVHDLERLLQRIDRAEAQGIAGAAAGPR